MPTLASAATTASLAPTSASVSPEKKWEAPAWPARMMGMSGCAGFWGGCSAGGLVRSGAAARPGRCRACCCCCCCCWPCRCGAGCSARSLQAGRNGQAGGPQAVRVQAGGVCTAAASPPHALGSCCDRCICLGPSGPQPQAQEAAEERGPRLWGRDMHGVAFARRLLL